MILQMELVLAEQAEGRHLCVLLIRRHSHVLNHNILVWHQAVDAVVPSLPPVLRRPLVQQQGGALLEGQLPGRTPDVVKLGDGFNRLTLCHRKRIRQVRYSVSDGAKTSERNTFLMLLQSGQTIQQMKRRKNTQYLCDRGSTFFCDET